MAKPSIFAREATGLVRELSTTDAALIGIQVINYGVGAMMSYAWSAFLYPGAIIWLAFLLGAIPLIFHGLSWGLTASAMPRSGADYVWVSRLLHGSIGFAITLVYTVFLQLATGGITAMISYNGFSQMFWQVGHITGDQQMFALSQLFLDKSMIFIVGTIVHVVLLINCILPLKRVMQGLWISFIIGNVGWAAMLLLMVTSSHADYVAAFNQYSSYQGVIDTAKGLGFTYAPSIAATLGALPLAFINMTGYAQVSYLGGEVKRAQKSLIIATVSSLVLSVIVFVVLGLLMEQTIGMEFVASAGYLYFGGAGKYPAGLPPPIVYFLASIMTKNPLISALISLGNILWIYGLVMVGVFYCSRAMFAWAFDRVVPTKLADINERWHSPVYSVVIQVAILEIGLAIATVAPIPLEMNFVLAYLLTTGCVTSFAITLFPWLRKDIFDLAPSLVKKKVLGIPFVSLCGGISFVWLLYLTYLTMTDPALGGTFGLTTIVVGYLAGFAIYLASRWYHKTHGIDLGLAFKQIPPE